MKLFCEVPHPEPGFGTPAAVGTSGPDGWVRIGKAALEAKVVEAFGEPSWVYAEAAGFAPEAHMNEFTSERCPGGDVDWPLSPATTTRVRLVDPLDRPVAGALVGLFLGCGHTPDARQATTGADGVATLEGTQVGRGAGYLWTVAEGRRDPTGYQSEPGSAPWEPLKVVSLDWAMTVEGTVLTHDGQPVAGVAIGRPTVHRGPWTHTDAQGRFRLVGSEANPGDSIQVEVGEFVVGPARAPRTGLVTSFAFPAPPPGHRATVRLPEPGTEPVEEPENLRLVVETDRTDWRKTTAESSIVVYAVRTSDGWTTTAPVGEQGVALLDVRSGAYVVEALGRQGNGGIVYSRGRAEVVVPAKGGAYARVAMPAPALQPLEIEWPETESDFDDVFVIADGATTRIRHRTKEDGVEDERRVEVLLPPGQDALVRVNWGARVPIDGKTLESAERAAALRVTPSARVEIRAKFVDADGKPAPGWLIEGDRRDPSSVPERLGDRPRATPWERVASGEHRTLVALPEDRRRFQPSFVDVPSVPADADPLELGEVRLASRAPALLVEDPDGAVRPTVLVTRDGRAETLSAAGDPAVGTSPRDRTPGASPHVVLDPWFAPGLLAPGALVRIGAWEEGLEAGELVLDVPFTRRLEAPGPWTLRAPRGALAVEVRGDGDAPIARFVVHLDGHRRVVDGARVRFVTLEQGSHEVVVEAEGRAPRRLRFSLADGEHRTWTARLRPGASRSK